MPNLISILPTNATTIQYLVRSGVGPCGPPDSACDPLSLALDIVSQVVQHGPNLCAD